MGVDRFGEVLGGMAHDLFHGKGVKAGGSCVSDEGMASIVWSVIDLFESFIKVVIPHPVSETVDRNEPCGL